MLLLIDLVFKEKCRLWETQGNCGPGTRFSTVAG